jgi:hypothetical protein
VSRPLLTGYPDTTEQVEPRLAFHGAVWMTLSRPRRSQPTASALTIAKDYSMPLMFRLRFHLGLMTLIRVQSLLAAGHLRPLR